jgi:translation elongation factor EF-Ts
MKYKKWTDQELLFIKHHCDNIADKIIAKKLSEITGESISNSMVRRQRRNMNIAKNKGRPKKDREKQ